jgi:hypothetical protein
MRDPQKGVCKICMGVHDEEIHAATLSIHSWFRDQVMLGLWDEEEIQPTQETAAVA